MKFDLTVLDSLHEPMFVATIEEKYLSAYLPHLVDRIATLKDVEPGTGNAGRMKQFMCTYDHKCITYANFKMLMDQIEI